MLATKKINVISLDFILNGILTFAYIICPLAVHEEKEAQIDYLLEELGQVLIANAKVVGHHGRRDSITPIAPL